MKCWRRERRKGRKEGRRTWEEEGLEGTQKSNSPLTHSTPGAFQVQNNSTGQQLREAGARLLVSAEVGGNLTVQFLFHFIGYNMLCTSQFFRTSAFQKKN